MNKFHVREDDQKFLLRAIRFCQAVDPYVEALDLDSIEVELFKSEMSALLHIQQNYRSFSINFILDDVRHMRQRLMQLVYQLLKSANYTKEIGVLLGIQSEMAFSVITLPELEMYKGHLN